jgi:hypothetical protein
MTGYAEVDSSYFRPRHHFRIVDHPLKGSFSAALQVDQVGQLRSDLWVVSGGPMPHPNH